jgi:hypothetical protein
MLKFLFASTIFAAAIACSPAKAQEAGPARSGYVSANGIDYYYEVHGEGEPLLLLHGGLGRIDIHRIHMRAAAICKNARK